MKHTGTVLLVALVSLISVRLANAEPAEGGKQQKAAKPIKLSDEVRAKCLKVLRDGMAGEEFWPAIHAAEALSLAGHGDEVQKFLLPKLPGEKDDQKRCGLARELVRAGDARQTQIMLDILAAENDYGHVHAAESLYKVNQIGDGKAMRRALEQDENFRLQLMAAAALARQGDNQAFEVIRKHLASSNPAASQTAAWILARVGDESDLPQLRKNAKSGDDRLYQAYQEHALAALGDKQALQILRKNLQDKDPGIRTFAAVFCIEANATKLKKQLIAQLDDPELDPRIRAAQALLVLAQEQEAKD